MKRKKQQRQMERFDFRSGYAKQKFGAEQEVRTTLEKLLYKHVEILSENRGSRGEYNEAVQSGRLASIEDCGFTLFAVETHVGQESSSENYSWRHGFVGVLEIRAVNEQ